MSHSDTKCFCVIFGQVAKTLFSFFPYRTIDGSVKLADEFCTYKSWHL